ncbi:hypothetical protein [Bradyrhizobium zhanjiangense]|uniref:Uncharacterized protein n=1 Tax=Bradyrhizobium zhanjiangense TaxID=1325107 RepID=A0A4Q0QL34_9BRAD|nr:hypothetical protein [Bradyrhizobium zhanjiangense]RXG94739.1 hypothetical protein EAS61_19805 [Bradyrhizobium zhanjiangense]
MLTPTESFFVRLLRGTVVTTAFISFLAAVLAVVYALYAQFAPEPQPNIPGSIARLRNAVDPAKLIKEAFGADSAIAKEAETPDHVAYQLSKPSQNELFQQFNTFLTRSLGASFESSNQFSDWLYGSNSIQFGWNRDLDRSSASNESNINVLWLSLLYDYAKRLDYRAPSIAAANKDKANTAGIDRFTASTPPSRAPYFLVWFFNKLQNELQQVGQDLQAERVQRAALRLTIPIALYVAAGAFSYFIFIMFLFLLVSIEASVRQLATSGIAAPGALPRAGIQDTT